MGFNSGFKGLNIYIYMRRTDHSSRGVLPNVARRCVWSRKPQEWGGHDSRWVAAPQQKNKYI